ncbi:hypothetical protein HPB47_016051 [Ixodes persulcatus]|uniref:Uncharacterized protein n=1 Tax=Ixodes persulcatus TaxID=34615 RepID=A0AC60QU91_IXOPE|nr:hypothetical protein HPB47_016051 [Ixodes persulcatus]
MVNIPSSDGNSSGEQVFIAAVQFNNLDVIANQETIVELVSFAHCLKASDTSRPVSGTAMEDGTLSTSPSQLDLDVPSTQASQSQISSMQLTFDFHRFNVLLLRSVSRKGSVSGQKVATATISGAKIQASIGSSLEIQGTLGGLQVCDLISEKTLHRRIVSMGSDPHLIQETHDLLSRRLYRATMPSGDSSDSQKAFEFTIKRSGLKASPEPRRSDADPTGGPGTGGSLECLDVLVRTASVCYIHSPQLLHELTSCAVEFKHCMAVLAKSIRDAATEVALGIVNMPSQPLGMSLHVESAEDSPAPAAQDVVVDETLADSLAVLPLDVRLDILLQTPVIVLPCSASSRNVLVAHLGRISVQNTDSSLLQSPQFAFNSCDPYKADVFFVQFRDVNLFSLNIDDNLGASAKAAPGAVAGFSPDLLPVVDLYSCRAHGRPILHDTVIEFTVEYRRGIEDQDLGWFNDGFTWLGDRGERTAASKQRRGKPTLEVSGTVINSLKFALTKHQYELMLQSINNIAYCDDLHINEDSSGEPTHFSSSWEDLVSKDILSLPERSQQVSKNAAEEMAQGSSKFVCCHVSFVLPEFVINLCSDMCEDRQDLVALSFQEFVVNYEKDSLFETNIQMALKGVLMEDLMEHSESSHRCLIRSTVPESQLESSRTAPPKSDFISVSCPDMTYHMPTLAAHPSLPDRLCTENVFQAHLKRSRGAGGLDARTFHPEDMPGSDLEMSEEDQVMRAIAMSLGENIVAGQSRTVEEEEEEKGQVEEEPPDPGVMDAFTENMLPGCLRLLDSLPDTVYRVCDLLGAVVARNGSAWRDQMLACLLQEVRTTVTALLEVAGREEVPQAERASQLSNLPEANMAAVRIHLFTLLFEEMRLPCASLLEEHDLVDPLVQLVDAAQRVLVLPVPPKEPPATPKWLVSLVLLVDLYEKASVASKRRAPLLQLPKRQWKWFDDRTGRWSTYQPQNNKAIDEAYCAVEPSVHFTAGRRKYTVQFSTMVQINEETGNWRPVMLAWDGKSSTPPPPATSCVGLLGLPVEPDTLHGVLRLSLRLTRCHEAAQAFASLGGPRLLLGLTQASAFSGFASLASLLVRHVVEEPPTLAHAMDKVARTMTAGGNSPMSSKELHYVLRVLGPAACRDADLFREVATSVLRISLLPMSKREEDDSRYTSANAVQILKYVAAKAPSSPPPVGGVVAQVMSDLLNVLPTPLPPTPPPQDAVASPQTRSHGRVAAGSIGISNSAPDVPLSLLATGWRCRRPMAGEEKTSSPLGRDSLVTERQEYLRIPAGLKIGKCKQLLSGNSGTRGLGALFVFSFGLNGALGFVGSAWREITCEPANEIAQTFHSRGNTNESVEQARAIADDNRSNEQRRSVRGARAEAAGQREPVAVATANGGAFCYHVLERANERGCMASLISTLATLPRQPRNTGVTPPESEECALSNAPKMEAISRARNPAPVKEPGWTLVVDGPRGKRRIGGGTRIPTATKLEIIGCVEKGEKKSSVAEAYNIPQSTLSTLLKAKSDIQSKAEQSKHSGARSVWTPAFEKVERSLHKWFMDARARNIPASGPMLQQKAKDFAFIHRAQNVAASSGWLQRFKACYDIVRKTVSLLCRYCSAIDGSGLALVDCLETVERAVIRHARPPSPLRTRITHRADRAQATLACEVQSKTPIQSNPTLQPDQPGHYAPLSLCFADVSRHSNYARATLLLPSLQQLHVTLSALSLYQLRALRGVTLGQSVAPSLDVGTQLTLSSEPTRCSASPHVATRRGSSSWTECGSGTGVEPRTEAKILKIVLGRTCKNDKDAAAAANYASVEEPGAMDAVAGSLSDAGGASPSANGVAGAGGNGGVPGTDLVREGSANDLLAQDEDPVPTLDPAGVEDGVAAAKDRSGPGSTGSRGGTPGPKEDKSQPLLPKSAVCRLLAELVRSYAPCARMVADHVYAAGQTELVPEEMSALGFILDHLLPQCQKAGDKDSPALARVLVAALASANHSPDTQTTLVNEVKGALHRALALPEGTEKHARIQALTGLVGTMIESCPPAQATSSFRQLHASDLVSQYGRLFIPFSMNNMVRVLLRRGLVTDLARIPHSLDLSSPHMAATVNSALKPLETLSRIVNLPAQGAPGTPRGAGRKGAGQGAGSQGVAGLGGGSARTPLQLASHEEGHEDEEDPRDGRENGGPPELEPIGSQNAEMSSSDATNAYGDATVDDNTDSESHAVPEEAVVVCSDGGAVLNEADSVDLEGIVDALLDRNQDDTPVLDGTLSARAELALRETEEEHDSQMIARDMISRDMEEAHQETTDSESNSDSGRSEEDEGEQDEENEDDVDEAEEDDDEDEEEYQDLEEALFRMQDRDDNLFFHFEEVFPSSGTSIMFGGSEGIRTYQLPIVPDESNNGAETSSPSIPPPPGTVASTHPLLVRHGDPQGGGPSSRLHRRPRGYRAQGTAHGAGPGGSGTWHVYANRHPNPPAILQRLLGPNTAQDILQLTSTFNPVASSTAQTRVVFANSDFRILATDEDLFEIQVQ